MSFFTDPIKKLNPFKKSVSSEQRINSNADNIFKQLINFGQPSGYHLYKNIAPIGHAVDMIAEKVSQLKPVVVDEGKAVVEGVSDVYQLLNKPNQTQLLMMEES